jgi:SulP family sulfate permease
VGVQSETKPGILLSGLISGLLMGFSGVIFTLSLGSLVFSGDLTAFLPYGIGMALASAAIMMVAVALMSSVPGVFGCTQDSSSVILAVIAAGLAANLSIVPVEERLATVLVAIATTTLLTGIFLLALGLFKLGGLVRSIPYPVVGGFLAGTGWLLAKGSFGVMSNVPLKLTNLPELFSPEQLITWVPSVIFALVLFFGL